MLPIGVITRHQGMFILDQFGFVMSILVVWVNGYNQNNGSNKSAIYWKPV